MEKIDYKKKFKELYAPKNKAMLIDVPDIKFITVEGKGNPNSSKEYSDALELIYGISYTIKMSKMKKDIKQIDGYFEYVIPPLEGLWWTETKGFSKDKKDNLCWISMIRQPEFVTEEVFCWAKEQLRKKKLELNVDKLVLKTINEGLCVQVLHIGPYDDEPESFKKIEDFISEKNLKKMFLKTQKWHHHEIYLTDPRKSKPENNRTILRVSVEKIKEENCL